MKRFLPLPWHVKFNAYGGYDCLTASYDIMSADKDQFAVCSIECPTHEEDADLRELAESIVEAVNAYSEMGRSRFHE